MADYMIDRSVILWLLRVRMQQLAGCSAHSTKKVRNTTCTRTTDFSFPNSLIFPWFYLVFPNISFPNSLIFTSSQKEKSCENSLQKSKTFWYFPDFFQPNEIPILALQNEIPQFSLIRGHPAERLTRAD